MSLASPTIQRLVATQAIPAAATTFYTAPTSPANVLVVVTAIWVSNTDAASHNVILYIVPKGGTPAVGNEILPNISVPPNTAFFISNNGDEVCTLAAEDMIQGICDTAALVNLTVIGRTFTDGN